MKRLDPGNKPKIGFVGQGWIGKNYADHYEDRGFTVIRYSLEQPHINNKDRIKDADIVFIAVPTPTTPNGFDARAVESALSLVGEGKLAVIKSTIAVGTTRMFANKFPKISIVHVPEFLRESYARYDVDNPERQIIGILDQNEEQMKLVDLLQSIGPTANYQRVCKAEEAEMIKYAHNTIGYATVVFANILHDLVVKHGIEWSGVKEAILNNPWYPAKYLDPVHKGGRGAGGDCFIKDFATLVQMYKQTMPDDKEGNELLEAFVRKNNQLLIDSGKDLELLRGVYGIK